MNKENFVLLCIGHPSLCRVLIYMVNTYLIKGMDILDVDNPDYRRLFDILHSTYEL